MATATPPPVLIGRRYLLYNRLGAGSMGAVYQATDRLTGQEVALKQVHVSLDQLDFGSRGDVDDSLQVTLAQEFKILASLRHPRIISVLDYGFDDRQQPYVTMEILENGRSITQAAKGRSPEEKINLLTQMLQALMYLHRRGVLHRDIKPHNVLVVEDDDGQHVKVLDFGLSVMRDQIEIGEIAGTPSYMAPELWYGQPATRNSDLYAVGVIAYEMFADRRPFDALDLRVLFKQVRDEMPDMSRLQAPPDIVYMIGRLLAKDPDDRYKDTSEVMTVLQEATDSELPLETVATRESFLQAATFVGRDVEMAHLLSGLNNAVAGKGSAWLISGESGVGKSRLIDELRTRALVKGALVVRGQAVQEGSVPYAMWRETLRWLSLITELNDDEASVLKALVPDIGDLIGREVADAPELSSQADLNRLLETIDHLFRRQAQPLIVLLEDIHWADSESLMVLARLNTLVYNRPLMLVGSFRNDERPNLPLDLPSMQVIHLERFSEDNTSKLAEAMLGSMKVTAPLLSLLQHETEGNVFFMVEVLRALAEEAGELEQITSSPLPSQVFTGGVEGIIRRRLSRVPKEAQPLLHVAAIAGRELDLTVIRDVLNTANRGDQLDVWLSNCSDAAVLEVDADQWRFSHNKLRDGVLADMPENARRELHKRVATSIQTVYQYTPKQPTAGALAHHWQAAGDFEKEEEYVGLAGEQAFKNDAYQTALQYFNRAIELQDSVDKPKRRQAALMLQLGDTYRVLEQHAEAREIHQQGLELCQAIGYKWGVASNLNSLGNVASETGNPDEAATYYIEALQTAMKIRAVPVALAVLVGMAGLLARVGDRVVATEYIGLVMRHPAVDSITHYLGQRVVQTLREELDEATFEAAYNTGKEQSLREVAERILAEE